MVDRILVIRSNSLLIFVTLCFWLSSGASLQQDKDIYDGEKDEDDTESEEESEEESPPIQNHKEKGMEHWNKSEYNWLVHC